MSETRMRSSSPPFTSDWLRTARPVVSCSAIAYPRSSTRSGERASKCAQSSAYPARASRTMGRPRPCKANRSASRRSRRRRVGKRPASLSFAVSPASMR